MVKFRLGGRQLLSVQAAEFGGDGRAVLDPNVMLHVVLGDWWEPLVRVHDLWELLEEFLERRCDIRAPAAGGGRLRNDGEGLRAGCIHQAARGDVHQEAEMAQEIDADDRELHVS
ncbi:MAG: hypothetical protein ACK583_17670 [Cyanobacteriota bacterium]